MSAGIFSKLFRVNVNFLNDSKEPKLLGISNKPQLISKFKYGRQSKLFVHNANDLGFSGNSFSLQQPLTLGVSRGSRPCMDVVWKTCQLVAKTKIMLYETFKLANVVWKARQFLARKRIKLCNKTFQPFQCCLAMYMSFFFIKKIELSSLTQLILINSVNLKTPIKIYNNNK